MLRMHSSLKHSSDGVVSASQFQPESPPDGSNIALNACSCETLIGRTIKICKKTNWLRMHAAARKPHQVHGDAGRRHGVPQCMAPARAPAAALCQLRRGVGRLLQRRLQNPGEPRQPPYLNYRFKSTNFPHRSRNHDFQKKIHFLSILRQGLGRFLHRRLQDPGEHAGHPICFRKLKV